jgi:hypothetical protein
LLQRGLEIITGVLKKVLMLAKLSLREKFREFELIKSTHVPIEIIIQVQINETYHSGTISNSMLHLHRKRGLKDKCLNN